jgi:two-component sensor histidine kinase
MDQTLTNSNSADQTKSQKELFANLNALLGLIRLQSSFPPESAHAAIARVASQVAAFSALYDTSATTDSQGSVSLSSWSSAFISSMERSLWHAGRIALITNGLNRRVAHSVAHALGLALGEILADAAGRALEAHEETRIEVSLIQKGENRFLLSVYDSRRSTSYPRLAAELMHRAGGELREYRGYGYSIRELEFDILSEAEED